MESGQQPVADFVRLETRRQLVSPQKLYRVGDQGIEIEFLPACFGPTGKRVAEQAQGQAVISQNGHPARVLAHQVHEAATQFNGGMPIEAAHEHALRPNPLDPQQIGAAMDDGFGLS